MGKPYVWRRSLIGAPVTCVAFIGRDAELAALHGARRALARAHGSAVLIGGEAGIGKTRLLAQFLRAAQDDRARFVATSECLERAQAPFGPIRDLLAAIYPKLDARELPANAMRAVAQLCEGAVGVPAPPSGVAPLEKPDLFAALASFFRSACSRRALVVTVEDIHWADRSTLEFLEYFVPRLSGTRLLVVATYRSDEVETNASLFDAVSRMQREPSTQMVDLQSLSGEETRRLIDGALQGRAPLPDQVARDIARRCEGNPFFAEELLKGVLDDRRNEQRLELPRSIRASILRRLAELDDSERRVIAHAAVLGHRFDPRLLAIIMVRDSDVVLRALRHARDLNIIIDEGGPGGRCRFRHALTRQTIYEDLLAFDAARLHAQVLATLENLPDADDYLEALAYNATAAHDTAKSLAYSERAGDAALNFTASFEACEHFERALGLANDDEHRATLLEKLAAAQHRLALNERARPNYERAQALRLSLGDFERAGSIEVRLQGVLGNQGLIEPALERTDAFLAAYEERITPRLRAEMRCGQAWIVSSFGTPERMRAYLALIESGSIASDELLQTRYAMCEATIAAIDGNPVEWAEAATRVEGMVDSDSSEFVQIASRLVLTGISVGANVRSAQWITAAAGASRDNGLLGVLGFLRSLEAMNEFLLGRLDRARVALAEAKANDGVYATRYHLALMCPLIGASIGDLDLVRSARDAAMIEQFRTKGQDGPFVVTAPAHALAAMLEGSREDARALFEEVVDNLRVPYYSMFALPLTARYVDMASLTKLVRFCEHTGAERRTVFRASWDHVAAIVAERSGNARDARELGEQAARRYAEIGWPLFEAAAREIGGDLAGARELYERCGAAADAARLAPREQRTARTVGSGRLSARESEVAELVSRGFTNAAIGEHISVSTKTVEKYLSSIFEKLGVRSRAQIAASVATRAAREDQRAAL